jgi:hypothetical protein
MKGRGLLFSILGCALLLAFGVLLAANLEWGEKQVWVGWQGEARTNPYLAAQRFLNRSGWPAEGSHGLPMRVLTGAEQAIVILPTRSRRLSPGQVAALRAFIERGGLLLAAGAGTEDPVIAETQDLLLAAFGARLVASNWWEQLQDKSPLEKQAFQDAHHTLAVKVGEDPAPICRVRFALGSRLEDRSGFAEAAIGDDTGLKLLVYRRGQGRAVFCTDLDWLQNATIGDHDHAAFLEALAGLAGSDPRKVVIVIRDAAPSLWAWLTARAAGALAAFAALLILALWWAMPRFGPLLPEPPEARRSLLEHLAACGRYQWRLRDGQSLLLAARKAALERIARTHPAWSALAPDPFCRRLAEHTGLSEERVFRALRFDRHPDPNGFTEAIQTLDLIRKQP